MANQLEKVYDWPQGTGKTDGRCSLHLLAAALAVLFDYAQECALYGQQDLLVFDCQSVLKHCTQFKRVHECIKVGHLSCSHTTDSLGCCRCAGASAAI